MKLRYKQIIASAIGFLALILLDQGSKILACRHLDSGQGGQDVLLWPGVFRLRYLENRGSAFGMLQDQRILLIIVTVLIFAALCWVYLRIPTEKRFSAMRWLVVVVMAGAIGNFIDRVCLGYVVDFFYFELINFPIFNVADIYITCAVVVFVILLCFYYKEADLDRVFSRKDQVKNKNE